MIQKRSEHCSSSGLSKKCDTSEVNQTKITNSLNQTDFGQFCCLFVIFFPHFLRVVWQTKTRRKNIWRISEILHCLEMQLFIESPRFAPGPGDGEEPREVWKTWNWWGLNFKKTESVCKESQIYEKDKNTNKSLSLGTWSSLKQQIQCILYRGTTSN